jgi:hypothetical protein
MEYFNFVATMLVSNQSQSSIPNKTWRMPSRAADLNSETKSCFCRLPVF